MEALTEGRRKEEGKLDPALHSIEGERSRFGSAAEGRSEQLVNSVANINLLSQGWTGSGYGLISHLLLGQMGRKGAVKSIFFTGFEKAESFQT